MAGDPPEDRIRLFPPLFIGGHEIALEVEVHGAWVDGTYEAVNERSEAVLKTIRMLYDVALAHRRTQQEGQA